MQSVPNPWSQSSQDHLARAYALVSHAVMEFAEAGTADGSLLAMACLHVQDQLEDCDAPQDADLLSVSPTGTAVELLRYADDELNAIPPAQRHHELLSVRASLLEILTRAGG